MTGNVPKLLTMKEAAALLSVTEPMLRKRRTQGNELLPPVKIGGRVRYKLDDIIALTNGQRQQAA